MDSDIERDIQKERERETERERNRETTQVMLCHGDVKSQEKEIFFDFQLENTIKLKLAWGQDLRILFF